MSKTTTTKSSSSSKPRLAKSSSLSSSSSTVSTSSTSSSSSSPTTSTTAWTWKQKRRVVTSITLLNMAILGAILYVYQQRRQQHSSFALSDAWFTDPDPFNATATSSSSSSSSSSFSSSRIPVRRRWRGTAGMGGLSLTILNALQTNDNDSSWHAALERTVNEWNAGPPHVVQLKLVQAQQSNAQPPQQQQHDADDDTSCIPVPGTIKVCKANHGPTGWRGINFLTLYQQEIVASVVQLNDYYFDTTTNTKKGSAHDDDDNNNDEKQYTICHEIGHGLVLGHAANANFDNEDSSKNKNNNDDDDDHELQGCMAYSRNPAAVKSPVLANFLALQQVYGVVMKEEEENDEGTLRQQSTSHDDHHRARRTMLRQRNKSKQKDASHSNHHSNHHNTKDEQVWSQELVNDILNAMQELAQVQKSSLDDAPHALYLAGWRSMIHPASQNNGGSTPTGAVAYHKDLEHGYAVQVSTV